MFQNNNNSIKKYKFFALIYIFLLTNIHAQYFYGPNKPGYKTIDYKFYYTPHFEIYHYFTNDSVLNTFAESAEQWYRRHLMIFRDSFKTRNPIIIYANHADFQQTNAIMGNIGIGTGGVTEALKNRVVLPVMESAAQTDHVLGHELVHAFQYRLMLGEDSNQMRNIRNIPIWMIEGMAEYLSIGSVDANTAMWMRDAIINNDFPSLEDLTRSYKYFPYRYGEAFWAFITGLRGDTIIKPLFDLTTKIGYERAIDSLTHLNEKALSNSWKTETKKFYFSFLKDTVEKPVGKKILSKKNSGAVNIAPSLSPDGKFVAFVSEKDLFTFDLYLADAYTGKIIHQLSSTIRDNKIDDFNFLESGGTWSPDGKYFAFVIYSKGKNKLLIINVQKTRKIEDYEIPGVDAFSNPSWSPDGNTIVVSGLNEAVTDLYSFNLKTKKVENLTHDSYSNTLPGWSNDGKYIAFSTDKPSESITDSSARGYNIALLNMQTRKINILPIFPGAHNLNPQFSPDNKWIYFLSDADGFRNLYRYSLDSGKVYRLTQLITGICGITEFTPAFSIDREKGNVIYTHYYKSEYNLYQASDTSFKPQLLSADSVNFAAAHLPPFMRTSINIIDENITGIHKQPLLPTDSFKAVPYKPKFQLDYVGGTSMGIGVNSFYGTGMAGSVDMLFSDMVGNYQLYSSLSLNGEIYDFAGAVSFMNNKNKINWGLSLSHIPYRYSYYGEGLDSLQSSNKYIPVDKVSIYNYRIFEDALTLFAVRPITQTTRVEAFSSFAYYSHRLDRFNYYYDASGSYITQSIDRNLPTEKGFTLETVGTAYTLDNAYMGIASPLRGQRFRAETDYYYGEMSFVNFLIDIRKYIFLNPFCIASRIYFDGRYGSSSTNDVVRALYIGWPWFVRGYDNYNYSSSQDASNLISQLFGSRMAVANLEFRIPFTGPERLCLIPFKYFFSELSFFIDGGLTWDSQHPVSLDRNADLAVYHVPLASYGVSFRVNLFGYMVLEPYYAIPMQKDGSKYANLGLNFLPGW